MEERKRAAQQTEGRPGGNGSVVDQLLAGTVAQFQLRMLDELDGLTAQLRAAGVGGATLSLPGAEEPDRVAAYTAMLFGRDVFFIMGEARTTALLTFGGTLSTFSPTSARVVAAWLDRLAQGLGGDGSDLPAHIAPRGVSAVTQAHLQAVLLGAMEAASAKEKAMARMRSQARTAGADLQEQVPAWACLLPCDSDELDALTQYVHGLAPGAVLKIRHYTQIVEAPSRAAPQLPAGKQGVIVRGRMGRPYEIGDYTMTSAQLRTTVLLTFCIDGPLVEYEASLSDCTRPSFPTSLSAASVSSGARLGSGPRKVLMSGAVRMLARSYVRDAAAAVRRRLTEAAAKLPGGGWDPDAVARVLSGCSWEHCAAIAGEKLPAEAVLHEHKQWWQTSDMLQSDEPQRRVSTALRRALLKRVPPPPPPSPPLSYAAAATTVTASAAASSRNAGGTDDEDRSSTAATAAASATARDQRQALEREVESFVADLMPLTHARYMAVSRAGGSETAGALGGGGGGSGGLLAEEMVVGVTVTQAGLGGIVEAIPQQDALRLALREAHDERSKQLAALTHPPRWLPVALFIVAVLMVAVSFYAVLVVVLLTMDWQQPQLVAVLCDKMDGIVAATARLAMTTYIPHGLVWLVGRLAALAPSSAGVCTSLWCAFKFVRTVTSQLPWDCGRVVTRVQDMLGLGSFMGRYNLAALQQRTQRQEAVWALRIAEASMREAVGRGRIAEREVRAIMAALQAGTATAPGDAGTSRNGGGPSISVGHRAFTEVTLPGSEEEVQAFLQLPVEEEQEGAQGQQQGGGSKGARAGAGGGGGSVVETLLEGLVTPSSPPQQAAAAGEDQLLLAGGSRNKRRGGHGGGGDNTGPRCVGKRKHISEAAGAGVLVGPAAGGQGRGLAGIGGGGNDSDSETDSGAVAGPSGTPSAPGAVAANSHRGAAARAAADGGNGGCAGQARRQGGRGAKAVSKMLQEDGWVMVRRGKHLVYRRFIFGGKAQTFTRSTTPSDWRTAVNQTAQLRRLNMDATMDNMFKMRVAAALAAEVAAEAGAEGDQPFILLGAAPLGAIGAQ